MQTTAAPAQPGQAPASAPAQESPFEAALANVKNQPVGPGTLGEAGMSESYLRRVAETVVRESFEDHYRLVVEDAHAQHAQQAQPAAPETPAASAGAGASAAWLAVSAIVVLALGAVLLFLRRPR